MVRKPYSISIFTALLLFAGTATAQTQVKGRVMVMVDSSGSMVWHFGDCVSTNGDSGNAAVFCDNNIGTGFACNKNLACTVGNGGRALFPTMLGNPSRLYAAKAALTDVINSASGALDFGLERYALGTAADYGVNICPDATSCCTPQIDGVTRGRCVPQIVDGYPNVPNSLNCFGNVNGPCNVTFAGGCGSTLNCINCTGTQGGQILVIPGVNSSQKVLPWVDFVEDFCSSTNAAGGPPRNPELRAVGGTPLAGTARTARVQWYQPIFAASNGGNCNPNINALCDPQINCRPYVNVIMTDGGETCEDPSVAFSDPQVAVQELYNVNNVNPVKTYVIAMSFAQNEPCNDGSCPLTGPNAGCTANVCTCANNLDCGKTCDGFQFVCGVDNLCHHPAQASLNAMAVAGGTGAARFANNQTDIEAAFADIAASSVLYEICNGIDDNCNGFIDEGLGVYQDCTANNQCASNICNAGRCGCNNVNQCNKGFACSGGLCVPSCSVGIGVCQRSGVKKCGAKGPDCCVDDGQPVCTLLMPGQPQPEVCNSGLDSDCDGVLDVCQNCTPQPETCNGVDDDCDGIIDNNLVDTGKACGLNIGICKPGKTVCVNGANMDIMNGGVADKMDHLICQGGVQPQAIQCNGCDNNCDGIVDSTTQSCYDGPNGTKDVGICHGGLQKCVANVCVQAAQYGLCVGEVLPQKEICNGLDDDCNGLIDDVMGANQPCCPSGKCGVGVCTAGVVKCSGGGLQCIGGQGPTAEICDGLDNDCNGKVDDVPNLGNPCVPMGGCQGTLQCDIVKMQLVCKSNGMIGKEICNGIDDDCDGVIDEPAAVAMNDPRVGKPCGNNLMLPPPCKAGVTICKNGTVVCDGAVGPTAEVCNGIDNDCDGDKDENAPCPPNFVCFNANCDPICGPNEFPCPGGYTPVNTTIMGKMVCICVADKNCTPPCANGLVCNTQNGMCEDPCKKVSCPPPLMCVGGSCYGCEKFGCSQQCTRCDQATHACVVDKCCNVNCLKGTYCDPNTGGCLATCANGCPTGQTCSNGMCVVDPCFKKNCPEAQSCDPKSGMCVQDPCTGKECVAHLACCGGVCVDDPCAAVKCPNDLICKVSSLSCGTSCVSPPPVITGPKDQIVGAGGGGFACSVTLGGTRRPSQEGALGLVLIGLLGLVTRRARRRRALPSAGRR